MVKMSELDNTLSERGNKYGEFAKQACLAQRIKGTFESGQNWKDPFIGRGSTVGAGLENYQREALELIATKIARILSGDPNHRDSWHDIAGYATLVVNKLREKAEQERKKSEKFQEEQIKRFEAKQEAEEKERALRDKNGAILKTGDVLITREGKWEIIDIENYHAFVVELSRRETAIWKKLNKKEIAEMEKIEQQEN